jgi:hypothetical protein
MQVINVITVKDGTVERLATFIQPDNGNTQQVEKAEADFLEQCKIIGAKIGPEEDEFDADDLLDTAYYSPTQDDPSKDLDYTQIVWSHFVSEP